MSVESHLAARAALRLHGTRGFSLGRGLNLELITDILSLPNLSFFPASILTLSSEAEASQ